MQTTPSGFTAESEDTVRSITEDFQVSWHKDTNLSGRTFTIGISIIDGSDIIGISPGAIGSPGIYNYFDEGAYVMSLGWERSLNVPLGGLSKALAEARLDNTSGRFTPRAMGGHSELYTAILPRRPAEISAGFNYNGIPQNIPQFAGISIEPPRIDSRAKDIRIKMADYTDFFENRFFDRTSMYTGQRSDQLMATFFNQLGMSTAQYDLDIGTTTIAFLIAESGKKFSEVFNGLAQAETGFIYQDEIGIFKFDNNTHWATPPHNSVVDTIYTAQVVQAYTTNINDSPLINVVEVKANPRAKVSTATMFSLATGAFIELATGVTDNFISFDNPVLGASAPTYAANSKSDGSGSNVTAQVSITKTTLFAQAAKYTINNASGATAYLTTFTVAGRWAPPIYTDGLYYRQQDDSSVTAYEERPVTIQNDNIQTLAQARTIATRLLNSYSDPENLQTIVIRAKPQLQLGDLISWQGHYWRIYDIKITFDPAAGFLQELALLQSN